MSYEIEEPIIDTSSRKIEKVKKDTLYPAGTVQPDDKYGMIVTKKKRHPYIGQKYVVCFIPKDRSTPGKKNQEFSINDQWYVFGLGVSFEVPQGIADHINEWMKVNGDAEERASSTKIDYVEYS